MKLAIISAINYLMINFSVPSYFISWNFLFSDLNSSLLFLFNNPTFWFGIKFLLIIAFLILIRGGTPRYRYDYLTKLGWLKFLTLVVWFFISLLTLYFFL